MAGVDRRTKKSEESNPVLRVADDQGANGGKEEEIEDQRCGGRGDQSEAKPPTSGNDQHQQKQRQRNSGVIGVIEVVIEGYNSDKPNCDEDPAYRIEDAFDGH